MNHGRAVRLARAARGLTQKQLAERADLDRSYVSLVEANRRTPSLAALETLSRVLEVPLPVLTLLAADERELRSLTPEQAGLLGQDLLRVLSTAG